jgi:hypothetical protein
MFDPFRKFSKPSKNQKTCGKINKFWMVQSLKPSTPIASPGRSTGGLESCPHGVHQSHAVTWAPLRKIAMFTLQETKITVESDPFIDDLPINTCVFP